MERKSFMSNIIDCETPQGVKFQAQGKVVQLKNKSWALFMEAVDEKFRNEIGLLGGTFETREKAEKALKRFVKAAQSGLSDLDVTYRGLGIALKYQNEFPFEIHADDRATSFVGLWFDDLTPQDREALEELGFEWDEELSIWHYEHPN